MLFACFNEIAKCKSQFSYDVTKEKHFDVNYMSRHHLMTYFQRFQFCIHFKMLSYIIYFQEWKNCFDFLSEPFSFAVLLDFSTEKLRLVIKLSPDRLFLRQIIRDPLSSHFRLEFNLSWFDDIESLVDFYHENYLYDWMSSTVTRLKLTRAVYNCVLSLQYLAGVALKKNLLSIPYPHLQNMGRSRPKYF